jgi:hypothetical protein
MLFDRFQKLQVYRDNWQGMLNMASAKYVSSRPFGPFHIATLANSLSSDYL